MFYRDDGQVKVKVVNLVNKTHKINGKRITYEFQEPFDGKEPLVVAVGSNKTLKFNRGAINLSFVADPSYNIGGVDEDNTLVLTLSGKGTVIDNKKLQSLRGSVTGQIGCGCMAYGHVSPTRTYHKFVTKEVQDVAPLYGTFKATFKGRHVEPDEELDDDD